jgi:hypothetical protein
VPQNRSICRSGRQAMTAEQVIAWVEATRGISLGTASAERIAGQLRAACAGLEALTEASLFDAEPAQFVVAQREARR